MSFKCLHCEKTFSSKSNLNYHEKNTKYCLDIQGSNIVDIECEYCKKVVGTAKILKTHLLSCKQYLIHTEVQKYEEKIAELTRQLDEQKSRYKELQDKMENILEKAISRPTYTSNKTNINNYIQKLEPVIEEKLKESADNLTIEHIKKGPEGYALRA